jgi:uncharacterized protein YqgC (DUF456 family)
MAYLARASAFAVGLSPGRGAKAAAMTGVEVLVGLAIAIGLVGVVVPVVPGALLVWAAIMVWGIAVGTATSWAVVAVASAAIAGGQVVKYTIPGKQLKTQGVPNRSLVIAGLVAIVGFFVIPVVGLFIGFVVGAYASELQRVGPRLAWPSTKAVLRAVGVSMLLELASVLLATTAWITGVIAT